MKTSWDELDEQAAREGHAMHGALNNAEVVQKSFKGGVWRSGGKHSTRAAASPGSGKFPHKMSRLPHAA